MTDHNEAALRRTLEQHDTPTLDRMLREALETEPVDAETVRLILSVLKEREAGMTFEYGPETEIALGKYRKKIPQSRSKAKLSLLYRAVAVAAAVCLILLVIPQNVAAERFFERLMRWTDSVFELFSPGEETSAPKYEFRTEHPGLQQVYDAVTELGITTPVVPMWIPEEYELVECKISDTPSRKGVTADFSSSGGSLIVKIDLYLEKTQYEYYKDPTSVELIEMAGLVHSIMRNDDSWVAVWTKDNIECFIHVDCQEDVLREMLRSIYTLE